MPHRIPNRLKFALERLMLRGPQYRLLIIAALIGLLSITGGALIHYFDPAWERGFADAVWWAFLRLSDPGYLGDDVGAVERTISTVLTILGYVVFLGALVAIMTQWLNARMLELQAGLTPIAQRDHVLIIGWTNRTATIVSELLLSSGRVRRFLQQHGARTLRIAILADEVTEELNIELRDRLGSLWKERQVILRTGSPLRIEHLRRVDFIHASAVIMPAADFGAGGPNQADTRTIKTLLSMTSHPQLRAGGQLPLAVAEIFDSRKIPVARNAYGGPIEILASDAIISRLLAQNVRHPGLSHVYGELLTHGRGTEIYIRECSELAGFTFRDAATAFPRAVPLGIVRTHGSSFDQLLNPSPHTILQQHDRLALLAHNYAGTEPAAPRPRSPALPLLAPLPLTAAPARPLRVLVLGWSHKVPALLHEFDSYADEAFAIDVVSTAPLSLRDTALGRFDFTPSRITVRHVEADYTTQSTLHRLDPGTCDNIILLGSDRLASGEESDARSIVAYLLLRDMLPGTDGPDVIVELLDASNATLFRGRAGEVIISPLILSHMLAQVALRRELRAVFDELFGPAGAEIVFRDPADYALHGTIAFEEIETAAAQRGEIALGVRTQQGPQQLSDIALAPERERRFDLDGAADIAALTTRGEPA
ncbi:MAG TPA: hypothetical protein VMN60_12005 [Longimicrobiales bacterium]|nr:hypothetical protein [Longimicrobiales bacterium]